MAATDSLGRYLLAVSDGGSYTITPTKTNVTFSPTSRSYANVTSDQSQDFTATLLTTVPDAPTISVVEPIQIGTVGAGYGFYLWTTNTTSIVVSAGTLPPGLAIVTTSDPITGIIDFAGATLEGTPTTAGTYSNIIISATNSSGSAQSQAFSITIKLPAPTITGHPATIGMLGIPYNTFTPTPCNPPFPSTCNATSLSISNALPPGLTFNTNTGIIIGTPITAGTYSNLVITAINADGSTPLQAFTITVSPVIDSFTPGAPMGTARQDHTSTLLPNNKVLVTGGRDIDQNPLASAEVYDPASASWSSAGAMTDARGLHTATLLKSGLVLVTGGTGSSAMLDSAELYDPVSNSWIIARSSVMANPRDNHTATLLSDGKVLVLGGFDLDYNAITAVEIYDPDTDTWNTVSPLSEGRYPNTATLLLNGKVLVAGGSYFNNAELYDPVNDTWSSAGTMNIPRSGHSATALSSGKVLIAGGYDLLGNDTSSAELYDPDSNIWSFVGNMATVRQAHTATLLSDNTVLVIGGRANLGTTPLAFAELYHPASGVWSIAGLLSFPRSSYTASLLSNGTVLVAGGSIDNTAMPTTEIYSAKPTITVTSPATTMAITSSATYTITWVAIAPNGDPVITLYYDTVGAGHNGTQIVTNLHANDPISSYAWNVSILADGAYYVYAKIDDGITTVYSYAPGKLIKKEHNGDVNGDGVVDTTDALGALRIVAGLATADKGELIRVDVAPMGNGVPQPDGRIDVGDVVVILRAAVGLINW